MGAFSAELQRLSRRTVWLSGGRSSWYLGADGSIIAIWPELVLAFKKRARRFDLGEHPTRYVEDQVLDPVAALRLGSFPRRRTSTRAAE